jgi:hypothetical protein
MFALHIRNMKDLVDVDTYLKPSPEEVKIERTDS